DEFVPEPCKPCDFRHSCGGGCRAEAERRTGGTLASPHPFMKKPIQLEQAVHKTTDIRHLIGKTFKPADRVKFREEGSAYLIKGNGREYLAVDKAGMYLLREIQGKGGIKVDDNLAKHDGFANFLEKTLQNNIMYEVAA
ncbi:hypothetical protein HY837_03075, partial [archaeon]|nr:hypothetical protein [archaeon]